MYDPDQCVYPIATANDKDQISAPLNVALCRDRDPGLYRRRKENLFSRFALPKVLKRIGMRQEECVLSEEALDKVIELYANTSGIRDLEQAAEHIAANALYQIEVDQKKQVVFDPLMIEKLLG